MCIIYGLGFEGRMFHDWASEYEIFVAIFLLRGGGLDNVRRDLD